MMPKGRAWRAVWLTWVIGVPLVLGAHLALMYQGTGCPVIGPRVRTDAFMTSLTSVIQTYRMANDDQWPPEEAAALARAVGSKDARPYQMTTFSARDLNRKGEPVDAWGTALRFDFSGARPRVLSAGEDRVFDTADDLVHEG